MKLYFSLMLFIIAFVIATMPCYAMAKQTSFPTANKAAMALYKAVEEKNKRTISDIFGAENMHLLPIDQVDSEDLDQFIAAWKKSNKLITQDKKQYYIEIGENNWTYPIPIIQSTDGWIFDTISGAENIIIRRLGRNELATIQTVLAYYDAQLEYAQEDRNGDGALEYAQKFRSTPGEKDGLYWQVNTGDKLSPLGSLLANKTPATAYNGYYYKILSSQGKNAKGGAYRFIDNSNRMTSGFALIAWPADFGRSGVLSFMINHAGIVYEKNLGPDYQEKEMTIDSFDPDPSWHIIEE